MEVEPFLARTHGRPDESYCQLATGACKQLAQHVGAPGRDQST